MPGSNNNPNTIRLPHLIVCEGKDDLFFLEYFIKTFPQFNGKFQVQEASGIGNIPVHVKSVKNLPTVSGRPSLSVIKSIIVVIDSDKNPGDASLFAQKLLGDGGFAVPSKPCEAAQSEINGRSIKVGYVLFPRLNSGNTEGALEDLCLSILKDSNQAKILNIVDDAMDSYKAQIGDLRRPHKNKLHAYLSLTDNFVGLKIGGAAKFDAFDFSSNALEPLKELLSEMIA